MESFATRPVLSFAGFSILLSGLLILTLANPRYFEKLLSLTVRRYPIFLGVYFFLLAVIRVLAKPVAEVDEAEQLYFAQWWSWGYGAQPPLYNWLQKGLIELLGYNLYSISLLRAFWYWIIFYFTYRIARRFFVQQWAVVGSLLLLSCIPLMINAFRTTHTMQATAVGVMTVYYWLRMPDRPDWKAYLWLGLCIGIGMLSKYNYALIVSALLAVSLVHGTSRAMLFTPRILFAILPAVLLFAPHGVWLISHWDEVSEAVRERISPESYPYLESIWRGLISFAHRGIVTVTSVCLFLFLFYRKRLHGLLRRPTPVGATFSPDLQKLVAFMVTGVSLCIILILSGQLSTFYKRWILLLFVLFPLPLVALLKPLGLPAKQLLQGLMLVAWLVPAVHALRYHGEYLLGIPNRTHCLFEKLPADWPQMKGDELNYLGEDYFISGNIKLRQPAAQVYSREGFQLVPLPESLLYVKSAGSRDSFLRRVHHVFPVYSDPCFEVCWVSED